MPVAQWRFFLFAPTDQTHPEYVPPSPNIRLNNPAASSGDPLDHTASLGQASPAIGTVKILVIMIDFSDKPGAQSSSYFNNLLFSGNYGSLKHYYNEVSYGLLNLNGTFAKNSWYRSANSMAYWGADSATEYDAANTNVYNLAREALTLANANVEYSAYDTDHDGILEDNELSICIIHAGDDQSSSNMSTDIWSQHWDIGSTALILDGVNLQGHSYWMQAETSPMGTFAHEFGHDLGLPDLYDTTGNSSGIGNWCLMSGGSWNGDPQGSSPAHPSAWCKIKLGWITPTIVAPTASIPGAIVPQVETNPTVYKLSYSANEYFLVENREKTGYDSALPGEGILIWHIDESMTNNDNAAHKMVDLEEAHGGIQDLDLKDYNGDANDPYTSNVNGFTGTTDPNSRAYDGRDTGVMVTHIGAAGSTMTVNFGSVETSPPTISSQTPSSGSIIANSRPTISASYSDVSGINQSSVVIKVDSVTVTSIASVNASGFSYNSSSSLPDGLHTVYLSVADNAGNIATSTWMFTIDTTPPTISSQSPASGSLAPARPTISATFSDNIGINPYSATITVDGITVTSSASVTTSGFSYTPSSSLSDGLHTVSVSIRDTTGNIVTSSWSFTVDTTPPTISSESPISGLIISVSRPTISATFSDNIGVNPSSAVIKLDGATVTSSASVTTSGFSYTPPSPLSDGSHTVYIFVADTAGNDATLTSTFTVDTTPPTISSHFPPIGVIITNATPTISATFLDSSGVNLSSVIVKLDGITVTASASVTTSGFSYTPPSSLSDGSHTVYVSVADTVGNVATSTWSFTVDTTPPTISSQSPSNGTTLYVLKSTQVTISASLSDNVGLNATSVTLKVDGVDVTARATIMATGISYSANMEAGNHIIQISASDNAGNTATSTVTFVMVDYTLYLVLAVIAVVAIVVVLILLKHKKHPVPQPAVSSQSSPVSPAPPSPTTAPPTPASAQAQPPSKAYCFYCGAENSTEAIYCQKCGKPMPQQSTTPSTGSS
jgi:immune inhibitor A